ncbi:unnamed protein product [Arctogadus glacialis]
MDETQAIGLTLCPWRLLTPLPVTGPVFGHQVDSCSEPEDDHQMKFYTEQHRGQRRIKGHPPSPLNKVNLTLITIITCVVAAVFATQNPCTLSVKVTLHVPEHFVADVSSETKKEAANLELVG